MSVPSLKYYSFKDITNFQDKIFADDYTHDVFETWKLKGVTTKGGKVEYKAKVRNNTSALEDELKISFPYQKYWFWIGQRRKGDIKVHVDLGDVSVKDKQFNLFTNVRTNVKMDNFQIRFGSNYWGKSCESSNRLEHAGQLCFSSRTLVNQNPFFYGYFATFSLNKFCALRYDAAIGWEKDNNFVYLQHFSNQQTSNSENKVGDLQIQLIKKKDDITFGVNFKRLADGNVKAWAAAQRQINSDWMVKGKVNNNLDLELATKYKVNSVLSLAASTKLELAKGAGIVDFTKFTPFPVGLTFELGI